MRPPARQLEGAMGVVFPAPGQQQNGNRDKRGCCLVVTLLEKTGASSVPEVALHSLIVLLGEGPAAWKPRRGSRIVVWLAEAVVASRAAVAMRRWQAARRRERRQERVGPLKAPISQLHVFSVVMEWATALRLSAFRCITTILVARSTGRGSGMRTSAVHDASPLRILVHVD